MGKESLAKNPTTRLLVSGSAIVGSTIYGVCTGDAFTSSALIVSSVLDVIKALAPEVLGDAFHDKFVNNDSREDILRNGDLTRAVGEAISLLILEESKKAVYGSFREIIRDFGKPRFLDWEGYVRETFDKQNAETLSIYPEIEKVLPSQLTRYFDRRDTDLDGIETLTKEVWTVIVKDLFNRKKYYPSAEVTEKIARSLHADFARALRKVLVDDFARDGKAYASLQLRVVGEILSYVKEIHQTNRQILDVVLAIDEKINLMLAQISAESQAIDGDFLQRQADSLNLFVINQLGQIALAEKSLAQQETQTGLQKRIVELLEKLIEAHAPPPEKPEDVFRGLHKSFPRVPKYFTGRKQVLEDLEKTLETENQASFYGTHGLGKTRAAVEYALRHKGKYDFILFISATKGNFVTNAAFVGAEISKGIEQATSLEAKFNLFIALLENNKNWLVIVDNVEDVSEVAGKIPAHFDGNVIYTSNLREIRNVAPPVTIEAMTPDEAKLTLLRRKLENNAAELETDSDKEREAITRIVEKIGTLPIALNLAGAFAGKYQMTFAEYLEDYEQFEDATFQNFDLADYYGENFIKGLNAEERAEYKGIAGVFLLSHQRIIKPRDESEKEKLISRTLEAILNLSVFLAPEKVPEEIWLEGLKLLDENLTEAAEDKLFWLEARDRLTQAAFFVRNADDKTFSTHRLILTILQKRLTEEEKRLFAEIAVNTVNNLFPEPDYENWKVCNRLQKHAETALNYAENLGIETQTIGRLYNQIAYYINNLAEYEKAIHFYRKALEIGEKTLGKDHLNYAIRLNNLAAVYQSQGRYEEAIELYKQALETGEKTIGKEHPDYATRLNNLAAVYQLQGRYEEAIELYKQALEIDEKTIGREHPDYAVDLNNLALVYDLQGRYEEAIELFKQSLEITEQTLGKDHPKYAIRLNNLAAVYQSQSRYEEATELYKQAIEIGEKTIGKEHPDYAIRLNNLANVYYSQGRYEEALPLFEESLEIFENTLPENHPNIQIVKNGLELCRQAAGKDEF